MATVEDLCDAHCVNIEQYQEAVEKIKHQYDHRITAILNTLCGDAVELGWQWEGTVCDTSTDEYKWSATISLDPEQEKKVDFTFTIEESLQNEDSTDGINFSLKAEKWGGWSNSTLGGITPFNYTEEVWVPVTDADEIEDRFSIIEIEAGDLLSLLPKIQSKRHRFKPGQSLRSTEPHARCIGRVCIEHAHDKSVVSCKTESNRERRAKQVTCKSGLPGWQCRLRDNYDNDFEQFKSCSRIYKIAKRLGFKNAEEAWHENPVIQGSTNPDDLCVVKSKKLTKRGSRTNK